MNLGKNLAKNPAVDDPAMGARTRAAGSPSSFEMRWKEPTGQDASELITRSRTELGYSC